MSRRRSRLQLIAVAIAVTAVAGCSAATVSSLRSHPPLSVPTAGPATTAPTTHPEDSTTASATDSATDSVPPTGVPTVPTPTPPDLSTPGIGVTGAAGIGDPYYPDAGNGGYDVASYGIDMRFDPATGIVAATTVITATVTSSGPLVRFNLDLQPDIAVRSVGIAAGGGPPTPAGFDRAGAELIITPPAGLAPGSVFAVDVAYDGRPGMISGGTSGLGDGGWYSPTGSGGALAAGEPFSASAWYPVNEHPADRATYTITVTVPERWQVIASGTPSSAQLPAPPAGMHTVQFVQREPIASYLTTVLVDKLTFTSGTFGDLPILNAFTPAAARDKDLAEQTPKILEVLSRHFGPFPFDSYGGIYTGESLPFALETASRPVYAGWVDLDTVIHETAHQWFGDHVTISRWSDVCLAECFASYAPWLFAADVDGADLDARWTDQMDQFIDDESFWASPLVDMGAGNEFSAVYDRGPLAIHALRHELGEAAFAALLTGWNRTFGGRNASFDDFEQYVNTLAGRDLTGFIDAWFRGTVVPPEPYRTPPGLS